MLKPLLKMDSKLFFIQKKGDSRLRLYSKEEYEAFFGITYLPTPYFASPELCLELKQNCPWLLLHTFFGEEHRSLGAYLHTSLNMGKVVDVSIRWIDEDVGYGLFAENLIAKESFIGQYTGIVRKNPSRVNGYCIQIPTKFWSFCRFILDAETAGNELRFANHSDRPSMKPLCLIDRSLVHIGFFATRDIKPGEELTFNYGMDYWKYRKGLKK